MFSLPLVWCPWNRILSWLLNYIQFNIPSTIPIQWHPISWQSCKCVYVLYTTWPGLCLIFKNWNILFWVICTNPIITKVRITKVRISNSSAIREFKGKCQLLMDGYIKTFQYIPIYIFIYRDKWSSSYSKIFGIVKRDLKNRIVKKGNRKVLIFLSNNLPLFMCL